MFIGLALFTSCAQQHLSRGDYSFFDKNFVLAPDSKLRTDGVYVLNKIWTDDNGGTEKKPDMHKFYKFYKTGQCNLTLDPENAIRTEQDYKTVVAKDVQAAHKKATLFEAYYKLKEDKIIIQGIVYPVKQFEYKYGYLADNMLIIVKATREGSGKFDDKNFTDYYKEYYSFIPLELTGSATDPNW